MTNPAASDSQAVTPPGARSGSARAPDRIVWGGLYLGDCLGVMTGWSGGQADLVYLDPPFASNRVYDAAPGPRPAEGGASQRTAFADVWGWDAAAAERQQRHLDLGSGDPLRTLAGSLQALLRPGPMLSYLGYMAERLAQCHRMLKASGSVYLHCDDTAVHYLKIVMDQIFGPDNYLNDITWRRSMSHNAAGRFGRICDRILFYSKNADRRYWNGHDPDAGTAKTGESLSRSCPRDDNDGRGRYRSNDLTGPGVRGGESGEPWNGYEVTGRGRHWAAPLTGRYAEWIEKHLIPGYRSIQGVHARLDALDAAAVIVHPGKPGGWPGLKRYAAADSGRAPPQNLILDPPGWTNFAKGPEWLGYPTQKPVGLLAPLIAAACPPGGAVLDPFAGSGAALDAARRIGRRWAGIDVNPEALRVTAVQRFGPQGADVVVEPGGEPGPRPG